MRILVIIYEFPPIGGGGGQAAHDICQKLASKGHEVHILTAHYKNLPRMEIQDGIKLIRVPSARRQLYRADLLAMSGFVIAGLWFGMRYIRKSTFDIIHVHFAVPSGPVAWLLSRYTHIPYVLTAHLGDVPEGVPEKTGRWFRWIYPFTPPIWRDAVKVVAVSEHTRDLAKKHYAVEPMVISNGVDLDLLNPGEIRVGNPPRVVFAGRFMHQKNPLQLVRTMASLKTMNWKCTLLGDGPLRIDVEREIQKSGLEDRFILTGWVTPQEVYNHLSQSDILFMPSLSEGLPVVGVQSLAMGLAIVASRVGGFIELVDEGKNGFLVDLENPNGYLTGLRKLLEDTACLKSFRLASREKAQEFDINRIVQAYENVFLSCI